MLEADCWKGNHIMKSVFFQRMKLTLWLWSVSLALVMSVVLVTLTEIFDIIHFWYCRKTA